MGMMKSKEKVNSADQEVRYPNGQMAKLNKIIKLSNFICSH